jgi:hypothetical protein
MQKLLDVIEDLDDVQDVYHNACSMSSEARRTRAALERASR